MFCEVQALQVAYCLCHIFFFLKKMLNIIKTILSSQVKAIVY